MRKLISFVLLLFVFNIMLVSAGIIINQPKTIYNVGDELKISAEVVSSEEGALRLNLVCDNANVNILNTREKKADFSIDLVSNSFYTEDYFSGDFLGLIGNCKIVGKFLTENYESQSFTISNDIELSFALANNEVEPGKTISLKGTAIKRNGEKFDGYIDISIDNGEIKSKTKVIAGSFDAKFSFPDNTKPGSYTVNAKVYEDYQGTVMNSGEKETLVYVKQVPKKIDIAINNPTVNPGESFTITPVIYDQAEQQYPADLSLSLIDPEGNVYINSLIKNGETNNIDLPTNLSYGYWTVSAVSSGLNQTRTFYVNSLEKLGFDLKEGVLTVTNVGNIPYDDKFEVLIGDVKKAVDIVLNLGETKTYVLSAPDGNYELKLNDISSSVDFQNVALTGDAIKIDERSYNDIFNLRFIIVWMFLISVLAMFIFALSNKIKKTNSISYAITDFKNKIRMPRISFSNMKPTSHEAAGYVMASSNSTPMRTAHHELVIDGKQEVASIISVRINNLNSMKNVAKDSISLIERAIIEQKGTIYENGNFIMGIFTPLGTKSNKNESIIIRVARNISEILENHNKKMKLKLDYGVGLHSGELAVAKEGDKLKFTNIGHTIPLSKKIAELAKDDVYLSENVHNKLMSELKSERAPVKEMNVFRIKGINQRENYQKFMDGFMRRQAGR